ncbi:MAG: CDP-diacylglycerol--glycerol-3-phosphate 3-phosphatidyltransferase [Ardenticatenales bacterium]
MARLNIANRITMARLIVGLVALVTLAMVESGAWPGGRSTGLWVSLVLFLVATISDALDGHLARSRGIVTVFGRIADPFVDKVVVAGALVLLTVIPESRALLAPWMVVVIVSREFLVTGIRGWMESEGINFQAERPGKYKMVLQVVAISGLLLMLATGAHALWFVWAIRAVIWATLALTLYSGWFYVRKAMSAAHGLAL